MNFADLKGCSTDYLYTASPTKQLISDDGTDRCTPQILLPSGLYRVFPEWSTCVDADPSEEFEIWDPPRVLLSGTALDALEDKLTTTSRPVTLSRIFSSAMTAITGPGLGLSVTKTISSTAMYDQTRSAVPTDPRSRYLSFHGQSGDNPKESDALGDSSPTTTNTADVFQIHISPNSVKSLRSITVLFYTTHYLHTDTRSRSSANEQETDTVAVSSSHLDRSSSTVSPDSHIHPIQPQSSTTFHAYPTTHPNDPIHHSKASFTTQAEVSTDHIPHPSLASDGPARGSSPKSPVAPSSKQLNGMAALIMAGFTNRPTSLPAHGKLIFARNPGFELQYKFR